MTTKDTKDHEGFVRGRSFVTFLSFVVKVFELSHPRNLPQWIKPGRWNTLLR
jgi:hypothetical protein